MITKRILTMKSKVGRGKYPDETVGRLLECDCTGYLRFVYYHFEEIDFTEEVKRAAGITIEIPKPGTSHEAYQQNERVGYDKLKEEVGEERYMAIAARAKKDKRIKDGAKRGQRYRDGFSRANMARVNQGHGFIKGS